MVSARLYLFVPVAQGRERAPQEREVAGSIPAGRISRHMLDDPQTPCSRGLRLLAGILATPDGCTYVTGDAGNAPAVRTPVRTSAWGSAGRCRTRHKTTPGRDCERAEPSLRAPNQSGASALFFVGEESGESVKLGQREESQVVVGGFRL